jgi:hypothetical protein
MTRNIGIKMKYIFMIVLLIGLLIGMVLDDYILQHLIVVGATYERCHHYSTPFEDKESVCIKKRVIAKKDGYIQYEIIESNSWMNTVGSIDSRKAGIFYWYNERK